MPKPEHILSPSEQKPENMMYGDLERAIHSASDEKGIRKLITEIRGRVDIPEHEEIAEGYEGGTFETRTKIAEGLLSKVMREAEIVKLGGKFTHVPSPYETPSEDGEGTFAPFNGETPSLDKRPQFYVTEVWDEKKTLWSSKTERARTNEVVVTVRLNNNPSNPAENTIIVAVLSHKNGVIDVKNGVMSGLFEVMSEDKYSSRLQGNESETYIGEVLRGELSSKKYKEAVGKEFGMSFKRYHNERDKNLGKEYANWVSNEVAPRLLDSLQLNYESLLQKSKERQEEILEQVAAERAAVAREADSRVKSMLEHLRSAGLEIDDDLKEKIGASVNKGLAAEIRKAKRKQKKKYGSGRLVNER